MSQQPETASLDALGGAIETPEPVRLSQAIAEWLESRQADIPQAEAE